MIVTKTPLRVSLFGGQTDFPEYYRNAPDGGAVIGFALDKFTYITARSLPPFFDHRYRCVWSKTELVKHPSSIENSLYRAGIIEHWDDSLGGLELHYDSDLPAKSGLGSSSSFAVGLILALAHLRGQPCGTTWELANRAINLERATLGEPGGHQDQVWAAVGGFNRIDFSARGCTVRPLGDPARLLRYCLLFYTGQQRAAAQLEGIKAERLRDNLDYLDAIRRCVDSAERLIADGDYAQLGSLLDVSWEMKKRLAPGVSYPELDAHYVAARAAGAWGGKLLGAGGGGFLLLMADPEVHGAIRRALYGLLEVPIGWSPRGTTVFELDGT